MSTCDLTWDNLIDSIFADGWTVEQLQELPKDESDALTDYHASKLPPKQAVLFGCGPIAEAIMSGTE